jgi:hypothetical protein
MRLGVDAVKDADAINSDMKPGKRSNHLKTADEMSEFAEKRLINVRLLIRDKHIKSLESVAELGHAPIRRERDIRHGFPEVWSGTI